MAHIDGHNHVHVFEPVRSVLLRLLYEWRVPRVRVPLDRALLCRAAAHAALSDDSAAAWRAQQSAFSVHVAHEAQCLLDALRASNAAERGSDAHCVLFNDAFVGLELLVEAESPTRSLDAYVALLADKLRAAKADGATLVEWMCHPGEPQTDGDGDAFSQSEGRRFEMEALCDERVAELLADFDDVDVDVLDIENLNKK